MAAEMQTLQLINSIEKDLEWFSLNYKNLIKKFDEKFIAIKDENIVAEGDTFEEVINKIEAKNLDPTNVLVKFVSKIKRIL